MANTVMGPGQVYRLMSPNPQGLGRYSRTVFAPRLEAERALAAQLQRFPEADMWIEVAATLDDAGHVLAPAQRVWRRA